MALSLTILGTATPHPVPDHPCSGYLLRAGDVAVAVDLGPGSLANLQRHHALDRLSAIWISHAHADHTLDLISLYYALAYGGLPPSAPIPVYAPRVVPDRLAGFFAQPDPSFLDGVFAFHALGDGHTVEVGTLRLVSHAVEHDVEAYALRAEHEGSVLAYSGDCRPCRGLDAAADGADLVLCESDLAAVAPGAPRWHHTPEETGALAARAGAGALLVTHVGPTLTREDATRRARAVFTGRVVMAAEGDTHLVARSAADGKARAPATKNRGGGT